MKGDQSVAYCKQQTRLIRNLAENIHDPHLTHILYKLVDSDMTHRWLLETQLIPTLASILSSSESLEVSRSFVWYC
jgi:hypothetical protein